MSCSNARRIVRVLLASVVTAGIAACAEAAIVVAKTFDSGVETGGLALQASTGHLFVFPDGNTADVLANDQLAIAVPAITG